MTSFASTPHGNLSRGILWLLLAVTLFVCMDSVAKFLTTRIPVSQIVWARYVFHLTAMLPVILWHGPLRLAVTSRPGLQIARSLMLLAVTLLFNMGFRHLPLATVTAIGFATPLVVTALAVPLLKEKVGPRRWAAVLVGFAGVLVVVRPGSGSFDLAVLFPLAGAVCNGCYQLATRALSGRDRALTTIFWTGLGGCAAMTPVMPWVWHSPDALEWGLLVLYGSLGFVSHYMLILAFHHASASVLAPFSYTQLVLAILSGVIFFHNVPDVWTLVGTTLICCSGLYVWYRQKQTSGT
ncbi:DMT family transporter [Telmatospirillum siberiense]|uniref:EamA/RhaT family transporter n=1 Tax=Telmatospirillum siberiense TaxID=382514 RepID=A0A2N3PWQ8_9PROT|nr:DMT family transporter [Telmatospirillum siberiense]PKU24830.1 EamA/RhaT family transporter [Telmatospirillum siberiense]